MLLTLTELEFHRDFDDDIDWHAVSLCRGKPPLADGVDRALIEAGAETLQQLHVADGLPSALTTISTTTSPSR